MYSDHLKSEADAEHIAAARSISDVPHGVRMVPYKHMRALLEERVEELGDKIFLRYYPDVGDRVEYTYREFRNAVYGTAHIMHQHGLQRGDRICTIAHNHSDTVVQYFAAWCLGIAVVPINTGEDDERVKYIIENSRAKLAFVRTPFIDRAASIINELDAPPQIIEAGNNPTGKYPVHQHELNLADPFYVPDGGVHISDEALIVYTSGTTGLPKGVVLEQYNLLVDAKGIAEWHEMQEGDRMMCVLPIHHVNGTVVTLLTPMYYGGGVILNRKFHTSTFFERIAKEGVQVVSVVPTLLQFLLHDEAETRQRNLSKFRHIICGAGPLTCELAKQFESRYNIPIMHGYGLSETTCYSCFLPVDQNSEEHNDWMQDHGFPSIGIAIPQNEMDIQTPEGKSVPEGERGEIVIRGHNVMKYYYQNPDANESTFANGWFRSGDEGFYKTDELGRKFFFITGRLKEIIIRGGVNLAPLEIDEVINTCPGVKIGIAVGFENDWYGEEVGALVQKADDSLLEEHVLEHCRHHLPFSKAPKVVIFSDDIPVTSTGKYQRNKVKHLFEQWKGEQFKK